jgi:hypothetical protein
VLWINTVGEEKRRYVTVLRGILDVCGPFLQPLTVLRWYVILYTVGYQ